MSKYKTKKVNGKSMAIHRYIMEQHIGRKLKTNEYVHHKNGKWYDNRIENLEIVSPKIHSIHHNQKYPIEKQCIVCKQIFEPHPTKRKRAKTCSRECFRKLISNMKQKITDKQVIEIYEFYKNKKYTQVQLAEKYNITQATIWNILHNRYFKIKEKIQI